MTHTRTPSGGGSLSARKIPFLTRPGRASPDVASSGLIKATRTSGRIAPSSGYTGNDDSAQDAGSEGVGDGVSDGSGNIPADMQLAQLLRTTALGKESPVAGATAPTYERKKSLKKYVLPHTRCIPFHGCRSILHLLWSCSPSPVSLYSLLLVCRCVLTAPCVVQAQPQRIEEVRCRQVFASAHSRLAS